MANVTITLTKREAEALREELAMQVTDVEGFPSGWEGCEDMRRALRRVVRKLQKQEVNRG